MKDVYDTIYQFSVDIDHDQVVEIRDLVLCYISIGLFYRAKAITWDQVYKELEFGKEEK